MPLRSWVVPMRLSDKTLLSTIATVAKRGSVYYDTQIRELYTVHFFRLFFRTVEPKDTVNEILVNTGRFHAMTLSSKLGSSMGLLRRVRG